MFSILKSTVMTSLASSSIDVSSEYRCCQPGYQTVLMGAVTVSLLAHHVKRSIFKNYRRNHRPMVHGAERIVVISIPTKRLVRRLALTTDILITRDLPAHHLDLRGRTKGLLGMIQRVMPFSPRASLGRTIRLCTKRTPLVNEAGQTCSLHT